MGRHPFFWEGKAIMFKTIVELVQFGSAAPGSSQRAADRLREHGQRGSVPSGWSGSCRQKIDALAKNRQGTSEKNYCKWYIYIMCVSYTKYHHHYLRKHGLHRGYWIYLKFKRMKLQESAASGSSSLHQKVQLLALSDAKLSRACLKKTTILYHILSHPYPITLVDYSGSKIQSLRFKIDY